MKCPAAVFTVVQNEAVFLPIWLQYYTKHFDPAHVYVLDHDSTDGSVVRAWRQYRPSVLQIHRAESFNHRWLADTVRKFQQFLLQSYEQVLFAEADEIVAPDPALFPRGLVEFVERNEQPVVRCRGYDLVEPVTGVEPIDLTRPILSQGRRLVYAPLYCKPLLARIPVPWRMGFHHTDDAPRPVDDRLWLVHLQRFDRGVCLARNRERVGRTWSAEDLATGRGYQSRIVDPQEFDHWFYRNPHATTIPVPDRFHGVI